MQSQHPPGAAWPIVDAASVSGPNTGLDPANYSDTIACLLDGLYRARGGKSTVLADDRPVPGEEDSLGSTISSPRERAGVHGD